METPVEGRATMTPEGQVMNDRPVLQSGKTHHDINP